MLESTSWHSGNGFAISKGPTIASSRFLFTFSDQCSSWLPVSTDSPASRTRTAANCDLQLRPDTGSELYVGLRMYSAGLYAAPIVYGIFALELLALLYLMRKDRFRFSISLPSAETLAQYRELWRRQPILGRVIAVTAFAAGKRSISSGQSLRWLKSNQDLTFRQTFLHWYREIRC